MVADRRDLMVETYSSYCGTGAAAMVWVCTGIACGAACGGADLAQAVSASTARGKHWAIQTGSLLKTNPLMRKILQEPSRFFPCRQLYFTPRSKGAGEVNSNSDTWM